MKIKQKITESDLKTLWINIGSFTKLEWFCVKRVELNYVCDAPMYVIYRNFKPWYASTSESSVVSQYNLK